MRLYVGNLSFNTGEQALQDLFATVGTVDSVKLVRDQMTGRSRGFAFVEIDDAGGKTACDTFDQKELEGRRLTVNEARPQESRGGAGGGGGFGGARRREPRW